MIADVSDRGYGEGDQVFGKSMVDVIPVVFLPVNVIALISSAFTR